ncbi:MAG: hypothetical protein M3N30_08300 [Bacteroidota bacterium]|nr:hypothetical protein [Bacteroidota bacterium]
MKNKIVLSLIICLAYIKNCWCQTLVLPTKEEVAWANAEMGVIIHLDINIYSQMAFLC